MRAEPAAHPAPSTGESNLQTRVAQFHHAVATRFACASNRVAVHRLTYEIGGGIVRLEFAGDALITSLTRALEHLRITTDRMAELTIGVWEIDSTGIGLPPPPWDNESYLHRGEILGFNEPDYVTVFNPDGRILFAYNVKAGRANIAVFNHAQLPAYECASPLRPVLARLETRGVQYLHAAAVGLADGGVLITGKGGAGKSTSSLACLDSPLFFAGDDYCAARFEGEPTVYSLYSSAKGRLDSISRFPFLEPLITNRETMARDKAIWYLNEQFSNKLIREFPLRAILVPRVTGERDTHWRPVPQRAALLALAPSTISQLPNAASDVVQHLASLTRQTPAYTLEVGTELSQIPAAILEILKLHAK